MRYLVTGGAGFIGSHLTELLIKSINKEDEIIIIDSLTYASNQEFIDGLKGKVSFYRGDIFRRDCIDQIMGLFKPDHVFHLAAETHVCNSIVDPAVFFKTNIMGTFNVIDSFKAHKRGGRFIHVSTDEVFGELSLNGEEKFNEDWPLKPRSPYAASKASSDLIVQAYFETYGVNACIVNCSNNFGPRQHLEKLIPRTVNKIMNKEKVTIYGDGKQVRDWLFVEDCAQGIMTVFREGRAGQRYCLGGDRLLTNLEMVEKIFSIVDTAYHNKYKMKVTHTKDRPTDDLKYALDNSKVKTIGWSPETRNFEKNLINTVMHYATKYN